MRRVIFKALGKLGVRTKSEPHLSIKKNAADRSSIPIWILGFARTGTTTAQAILAEAFDYNASFEPFGFNDAESKQFELANKYFRGNPTAAEQSCFARDSICPAALETITDPDQAHRLVGIFNRYIDSQYDVYGRNVVIKELRIISNIAQLHKYHEENNIPLVVVGVISNPYQPLYTYYRLGGLSLSNNLSSLRVSDIYRYRMLTYEALGLFPEIRELVTNSAADELLVSILLDQAMLLRCADLKLIHVITSLAELEKHLPTISALTSRVVNEKDRPRISTSSRYLSDRYFHELVIEKLSPDISSYIDANYQSPDFRIKESSGFGLRQMITALRHRIYEKC